MILDFKTTGKRTKTKEEELSKIKRQIRILIYRYTIFEFLFGQPYRDTLKRFKKG
jgi:hypothetical protein